MRQLKRTGISTVIFTFVIWLIFVSSGAESLQLHELDSWKKPETSILYDLSADLNASVGDTQSLGIWPYSHAFHVYLSNLGGDLAVIVNENVRRNTASLQEILHQHKNKNDCIDNLLATKSNMLESIIISFGVAERCNCGASVAKFSHFVEGKMKAFQENNVKIGLELDMHFLACCKDQLEFKFLDSIDHIVFRVDLNCSLTLSIMLSYGLFVESSVKFIEKIKKFVESFNPHSALYIRPVFENGTCDQLAIPYDALITGYLKAWTSDIKYTGNETYILRHSNFSATGNRQFLKEKVTTPIFMENDSICNSGNSYHQRISECGKILKLVRSSFANILLVNPSWSFFEDNHQIINKETRGHTSVLFKKGDVTQEEVVKISGKLFGSNMAANLYAIYIDSEYQQLELNQHAHLKNIKIGCYMKMEMDEHSGNSVSNLVDKMSNDCREHLAVSAPQVLLHVSFSIRHKYFVWLLVKLLSNVHKTKQALMEKYPKITVVLMIQFAYLPSRKQQNNYKELYSKMPPNAIYCNEHIQRINEYHQAILTFARIHQWNELVLQFGSSKNDFGPWRNVETDGEINRTATNFPLLSRSNSERSINGESLPMTHACINKTEKAEKNGINFQERQYSGATFTAKLRKSRPLSPEEVQMLIHFSLSRFPFVEISQVDQQELSQMNTIVSPWKFNTSTNMPTIYFQLSLDEPDNLEKQFLNIMAQDYAGIHISDWEDRPLEEMSSVISLVKDETKFSPKFGIVIKSCSNEINMGLKRLKKLPFIDKVGYVICNLNPIIPGQSSQAKMQKYLDTVFYTKSYMEQALSHNNKSQVDILFRVNIQSAATKCSGDPTDLNKDFFLRIVNDVSQHAMAFKIRYFIVSAFEREELAKRCSHTWWGITDYTDLANASVYVDRERELFGKDTLEGIILPKKPPKNKSTKPPGQKSDPSDDKSIFVYTVPLIAGILILAVLLLWFQRRYYEKSFLTQREVSQFYKPFKMNDNELPLDEANTLNTAYLKFSSNYEISARDIEVQDEIGRGQFGVVHVGILARKTQVAIKLPREGCSKEDFLSALSELKILCYVGRHPNIVSFLGAHTKNICSGKLMIVIEYCGKGSVESYIRSVDSNPDLNQLYEFAHQIAAGMEHLSEKRIIHGDLATRNVLLAEDFTCKITDFGLSRRLYDMNVYVKRGNESLPWMWMAIESLTDMEFTTKSDVWSYAVTLWEIFTLGKLPYPGKFLTQGFIMELESGIRMEKAQYASDPVHQKMLECWSLDQDERPTFAQLKQFFAMIKNHQYQNTSFN